MSFTITSGPATVPAVTVSGVATVTIPDVNGGTNLPANTTVYAAFATGTYDETPATSSGVHPTVTIGGQAAQFIGYDGNDFVLYLYSAVMPGTSQVDTVTITDPTADFVGTWSCGILTVSGGTVASFAQNYGTNFGSLENEHGVTSWPSADPISIAPFSATFAGGRYTSATPLSITVPTGGFGIVAAWSPVVNTPAWTTGGTSNITASGGDINNSITTPIAQQLLLAHTTTAGTWGPLLTGTPNYTTDANEGLAIVAATFAPGGGAAARTPTLTLMGVG
jgi:hypothetical protein